MHRLCLNGGSPAKGREGENEMFARKPRVISAEMPFIESEGPLIASITEYTRLTNGGAACVILMVLSAIGMFLGYAGAKDAIQEIDVAVGSLAFIVLFGIGAIMGRRRVYLVHRETPAPTDQ